MGCCDFRLSLQVLQSPQCSYALLVTRNSAHMHAAPCAHHCCPIALRAAWRFRAVAACARRAAVISVFSSTARLSDVAHCAYAAVRHAATEADSRCGVLEGVLAPCNMRHAAAFATHGILVERIRNAAPTHKRCRELFGNIQRRGSGVRLGALPDVVCSMLQLADLCRDVSSDESLGY